MAPTVRRDLLLDIQARAQQKWEDLKVFESCAPDEGALSSHLGGFKDSKVFVEPRRCLLIPFGPHQVQERYPVWAKNIGILGSYSIGLCHDIVVLQLYTELYTHRVF